MLLERHLQRTVSFGNVLTGDANSSGEGKH